MTENGNGNDEKTKPERGEDGRFLPGGPGGPGRGKKANEFDLNDLSDDDFWDAIEVSIRKDMMSGDVMTRQRGMKLKMMKDEYLLKRSAESKAESIITPAILEMLELNKMLQYFGGIEGLKAMLKTCPGCAKFPGKPPRDFGFDKYHGG